MASEWFEYSWTVNGIIKTLLFLLRSEVYKNIRIYYRSYNRVLHAQILISQTATVLGPLFCFSYPN